MIQRGEKIQYTLLEKYIEHSAHSSIIPVCHIEIIIMIAQRPLSTAHRYTE